MGRFAAHVEQQNEKRQKRVTLEGGEKRKKKQKTMGFGVIDLKMMHFFPPPPPHTVQAAEARRRRDAAREAAVGQRRSLGGLQEDALRRQRDFEQKVSLGLLPPHPPHCGTPPLL